MKTDTLSTTAPAALPAVLAFPYMQECGEAQSTAARAGHYTEITDHAGHLSGEAYDKATRERPRYSLTVRPFAVGDGATVCGYSDRHAFTVLSRTARSMTLQRDKATLQNGANSGAPDALQFTPGGFVGHTSDRQRWEYEPDPFGEVQIARLTVRGWEVKGERVCAGRSEHYDHNF